MEQGGTAPRITVSSPQIIQNLSVFLRLSPPYGEDSRSDLCQLTSRKSPIAYLAILAYAVDCVLIVAELDGVDFPIVCLPAHGALMLLHI